MKKSYRLPLILFSICLVMILAFSALAEGALATLYNASTALLFDTSNVTLTAHAEFTYDAQHFKTFDGKYVQDDVNSLLQVTMTTPTRNGDSYQSGYTVIANGEKVYERHMDSRDERFSPLHGKASSSVLSDEAMRDLAMGLGATLINLLEAPVNAAITTEKTESGTAYSLRYKAGDAPEALSSAISQVSKEVLGHYFFTPYLFKVPTVVFENRDALARTLYQETYHMPFPTESDRYDKSGNLTASGLRYKNINEEINALKNEIAATTQYSAVVVHADKSQTGYNTFNDYLLSQGQQMIQYEDYSLTLDLYSQQHPTSADPASDMRAHYKNILTKNNCAGMLVESDGDYILCYNDDTLCRLAPYSRTIAERIRIQLEEIALGETDATLTLDNEGRIASLTGRCTLLLTDFVGREHTLTITFDCAAEDYGQSVVEEFVQKDNPNEGNG